MPRKNRPATQPLRPLPQRNCRDKRVYRNEHEAQKAAENQMLLQPQLELTWYRCDMCLYWHLTRKK